MIQKDPVDKGDHILISYEVGTIEAGGDIQPESQSEEYIPYVPELSLEERVGTVETKTVTIEETLDVLLGGV